MQRRELYDPSADISMMLNEVRSMNLLDFNRNRQKDLFLCDIYSD